MFLLCLVKSRPAFLPLRCLLSSSADRASSPCPTRSSWLVVRTALARSFFVGAITKASKNGLVQAGPSTLACYLLLLVVLSPARRGYFCSICAHSRGFPALSRR